MDARNIVYFQAKRKTTARLARNLSLQARGAQPGSEGLRARYSLATP